MQRKPPIMKLQQKALFPPSSRYFPVPYFFVSADKKAAKPKAAPKPKPAPKAPAKPKPKGKAQATNAVPSQRGWLGAR